MGSTRVITDASGSGTPLFNRSYTYDPVNRLVTMSSPADPYGCYGLSWTYDAWGNRNVQSATSGSCPTFNDVANSNNQLTAPYQYDAAGNLTNDGTHSYGYDAEDRLTQVDGGGTASYVYDANGQRVEKVTASGQVHYFYDEDGNVIVERDQSGVWLKDYVYMGGRHVAEFSGGQTYFVHGDHLGSTRIVTDVTGNVADSLDYLPYGEQIAGDTFTTHKFTGKERDSETGNDYFGARYNSSSIGRFMSPDPGNAGASATNPQSWNMYAYTMNNPVSLTDPTGMTARQVFLSDEDSGISYTMDGVPVPSNVALSVIGVSGVRCPHDMCSGFGTNASGQTVWSQFYAFAGGVSGYYNPADLANGINEADGGIMNDANYNVYLNKTYEKYITNQYNRLLVDAAKDFPAKSYQVSASNPTVTGGHANFAFTCYQSSKCGPGRYELGVHVHIVDGQMLVHNDTVSPWEGSFSLGDIFTGNLWEHGFVDLIGGSFTTVFPQ
jgi:RHS repeat-associated protein